MQFTVNFSNLNIEINTKYNYTYKFCRDYLTDEKPDFSVSPIEEEIDEEIEISEFNPSRGYAESICVYRKIADMLPFYDRMVFHGAVISYNNNGYIFTAPSGTGKTTHISLWQKYLQGVEIVNGDKPILNIENGKVTAYATPYAGKEGYQNHSSIEIKGICIIHRLNNSCLPLGGKVSAQLTDEGSTPDDPQIKTPVGADIIRPPKSGAGDPPEILNSQFSILNSDKPQCNIRRVKTSEYLTEMIAQMYMPPEPAAAVKTLDMLDILVKTIPVYILECDISEQAVRTSFEALTNTKYPL